MRGGWALGRGTVPPKIPDPGPPQPPSKILHSPPPCTKPLVFSSNGIRGMQEPETRAFDDRESHGSSIQQETSGFVCRRATRVVQPGGAGRAAREALVCGHSEKAGAKRAAAANPAGNQGQKRSTTNSSGNPGKLGRKRVEAHRPRGSSRKPAGYALASCTPDTGPARGGRSRCNGRLRAQQESSRFARSRAKRPRTEALSRSTAACVRPARIENGSPLLSLRFATRPAVGRARPLFSAVLAIGRCTPATGPVATAEFPAFAR